MTLYEIVYRLTRADGSLDRPAIRAKARELCGKAIYRPLIDGERFTVSSIEYLHFRDGLRTALRIALHERDTIVRNLAMNAHWEATKFYEEAEAARIAALYRFSPSALAFQVSRREFGSFATTNARHDLPIYRRAFQIAAARAA